MPDWHSFIDSGNSLTFVVASGADDVVIAAQYRNVSDVWITDMPVGTERD